MSETVSTAQEPPARPEQSSAGEVAAVFLRLGCTAFGGPAAHVSIMEDELVRRRGWLSREQFLDLLGIVNLIPGPNSTEMAMYVGHVRAGWLGLVAAGCAFILPATLMVTAIAWAYVRLQGLAGLDEHGGPMSVLFHGLLYGMKPVVIAIITQALWRLGRTAVKTPLLAAVGLAVAITGWLELDALMLMLGGGLVVGLARAAQGTVPIFGHGFDTMSGQSASARKWDCPPSLAANTRQVAIMLLVTAGILGIAFGLAQLGSASGNDYSLVALFLYFLKIGAVLYGTGYVLLAFLQADLVPGWITASQLLDATAVGQVTPGPLFTSATFIGYLKGGPVGAVVATVAIFLPAFIYTALSGKLVPRLKESPIARAFLDGVNVAALALMAVVTWKLGCQALVEPGTGQLLWAPVVLALVSLALLLWRRVPSIWLLLGGALAGIALAAAGMGGAPM